MTTTTVVRPTDIYTPSTVTLYPATIIGTGAVWSDDSTATYVEITGDNAGTGQHAAARGHIADGTFSNLIGLAGTQFSVGFRLANVNDVDFSTTGNFGFSDDAGDFSAGAQAVAMSDLLAGMDANGWIDFGPITQADLDAGNLNGNRAPYNLFFFSNNNTLDDAWRGVSRYLFVTGQGRTDGADGTTTHEYDVLEARITVVANVGAVTYYLAPRRLHPREDAQGIGAARLWPPPRSRRNFGGYV